MPLGGGGGEDFAGGLPGPSIPPPAFSDICDRNRGFAQEGLHFQDSGISAPLKELTFSQLFQEFRKDVQPEGGDPAGIPDSGRISSRRVEIQQEFRNSCEGIPDRNSRTAVNTTRQRVPEARWRNFLQSAERVGGVIDLRRKVL